MSYLADLRTELGFILFDWLGEEDRETGGAILDLSERLAATSFASHHRLSDSHEPRIVNGEVQTIAEAKPALAQYRDMGLFGASFPPKIGGMGLSQTLSSASFALFAAANPAFSAFAMLTAANARLLAAFGSPEQVDWFARPQVEGRWFGTMCLSEPDAGSSLADIKTRAIPDGKDDFGARYRLAGHKMWISGAEQDISENIVHLVLAKAVDENGEVRPGAAGISLFVVPRFLPGGDANDIVVAGLNHKLGYRGIPNCAVNFGEGAHRPAGAAGAVGWLIGREGDGLRQMFQMMNEARIGVSLGAAALGYRGFRQSTTYALERFQGKDDAGATVPIIVHPDVQLMLLRQKYYSEGSLALALYSARLGDRDEEALLDLLTPIVKSWTSTWSVKANDLAIQVHGGSGYTRDFDAELLWRDNRLNPIHEGTNGIQAIDLVDRKLLRGDRAALHELKHRIFESISAAAAIPELAALAPPLQRSWYQVERAIDALGEVERRDRLFNAGACLDAIGHVVVGWLLLDQLVALAAAETPFAESKRRACEAFFMLELPMVASWIGAAATAPAMPLDLRDF